MKTKEQIKIEAEKVISLGSKLSIEKIITMIEKKEASNSKREKRSLKKWNKRDEAKNIKVETCNSNELGEINRENARKNLPSSMR